MKKLVYIASKYSFGDNFVNTQKQIEVANMLLDEGFIPISPLMNSVWYNMQKERSWDFWMGHDFHLLDQCECLLRLPGDSKGADMEVAYALEYGKKVYYDIESLIKEK